MRILYFSQSRAAAGVAEETIAVASPLDEVALRDLLERRHPALAGQRAITRLARNGAFTRPGELFHDEDEVALIPPVSGG